MAERGLIAGIIRTKWFARFARQEAPTEKFVSAVREIENGLTIATSVVGWRRNGSVALALENVAAIEHLRLQVKK